METGVGPSYDSLEEDEEDVENDDVSLDEDEDVEPDLDDEDLEEDVDAGESNEIDDELNDEIFIESYRDGAINNPSATLDEASIETDKPIDLSPNISKI